MKTNMRPWSFLLSEEDRQALRDIANERGCTSTAVLRSLIRRAWRREVEVRKKNEQTRPDQTGPDQRRCAA
jgi:hypothetical protein